MLRWGASTQLSYTGWESYGNIGGYGRNGTQGGAPNHASGGGGGAGYQGENQYNPTDDRTWRNTAEVVDGGVGIDFLLFLVQNMVIMDGLQEAEVDKLINAGREGWGNSYTGTSNNIRGFGGGGDGGFCPPVKEATKGIDGTGGGGGGARTNVAGADGGSGIVLIKYSTLKSNPFSIIPSSSRIAVKGLKYHYYQNGYFNDNTNWFRDKTPQATGYVCVGNDIKTLSNDTRRANSRNNYSFEWTGYFKAREGGTYTFSIGSDDASYLWIGDDANADYSTGNVTLIIKAHILYK